MLSVNGAARHLFPAHITSPNQQGQEKATIIYTMIELFRKELTLAKFLKDAPENFSKENCWSTEFIKSHLPKF